MISILVTGASGAIGTMLCERLSDMDYKVIGLSLSEPRWETGVSIIQADLMSSPELPEVDVIVHLAAHSRVPPTISDPTKAFQNVAMLEPILEHARQTNASVIFASSREIYGNAIRPSEGNVNLNSTNPYGGSKLACEVFCNAYFECYDVPITTLRLSNVYGRYDRNTRVVPIFIALATAGRELTVFGERKVLDFVHMDDVSEAFASTIDRGSALAGETVNVGSGNATPLTMLAEHVVQQVPDAPGYRVEPDRGGEVSRFVADISKARSLLDWEPVTSLDCGLARTIEWYREHPDVLDEIREAINSNGE